MLGTSVNLQFRKHVASEIVFLGEHSLDGQEDQVGWFSLESLAVAFHLLSMVPVIPSVMAMFEFSARHLNLLSVDHNDVLAGINVWGVFRAMLAHQNHGDLAGQTPQRAVGRIDDEPFLLNRTRFRDGGFLLDAFFRFDHFSSFGHCQVSLSIRFQRGVDRTPNRNQIFS